MRITVDYGKKQYGTGGTIRRYKVTVRDVNDIYIENSTNSVDDCYESRELELCFRGLSSTAGRSWDEWSEAEVLGGRLELSHDAARQLANAILQFLNERERKGHEESMEIEVNEKPEARRNGS